jgi:hypothetical protein
MHQKQPPAKVAVSKPSARLFEAFKKEKPMISVRIKRKFNFFMCHPFMDKYEKGKE